jgi:hypothetical protein
MLKEMEARRDAFRNGNTLLEANSGRRQAVEVSLHLAPREVREHLEACKMKTLYKTAYSPSPSWPFDRMKWIAARDSKALAPDSLVN